MSTVSRREIWRFRIAYSCFALLLIAGLVPTQSIHAWHRSISVYFELIPLIVIGPICIVESAMSLKTNNISVRCIAAAMLILVITTELIYVCNWNDHISLITWSWW